MAKQHDNTGTSNRRKWIKRTASGLLGLVVASEESVSHNVGGVQSGLLFHPGTNLDGHAIEPIKAPEQYDLKNIVACELETANKEPFVIWRSLPIEPNKPTLILFPGSVGHLGDTHMSMDANDKDKEAYVRIIQEAQARGMQVIAVNYPGFAGSKALATQDGLYGAAEVAIDHALEYGIKPQDLKITGISMGTMVASHAASHLAQSRRFKSAPDQSINLTLVSGTLSAPHGAKDQSKIPLWLGNLLLRGQSFDVKTELHALATHAQKHAKVTYLRGVDDAFTPAYHASEHAVATRGSEFQAFVVPGSHFPDARLVLDAVQGKTQNMEIEKLDIGILTQDRVAARRKDFTLGK